VGNAGAVEQSADGRYQHDVIGAKQFAQDIL
jgi:hypothetical protein